MGRATVEVGYRIQYRGRRRSRPRCWLVVRSRLASLGESCLEEEGGAADPFTSLFSPSRPMEPGTAWQRMTDGSRVSGLSYSLFLQHNRSSSSAEVMRTTTRATCLAITREGGGEERKGKKRKRRDWTGRDLSRDGKGKGRERRGEQAKHSVGTRAAAVARVSPAGYEEKGYFPVPACKWDCDYDSPGAGRARTSVQSPQRATQRAQERRPRGDQRRCIGSIKFRLAHPPPTRWMGRCAVIGRVVPCCRSRWGLFSENLGPPCHWHF